ncbi:MAG: 3-methyl-2-oxobutanoate hydroxymethyltransferase [Gammaproteobacteria bacterium]|nr:3-methyl-2-oxobutanoate hydroxymethyltransferase [Gammaproteobacteria bacterium]
MSRPLTLVDLRGMKSRGERMVCLTAYDASFARLVEAAGAELVLVGDSLGMVVQGHDTTLPVTLDEMIYHTRCVARGLRSVAGRAMLIADLPFMSYATPEQALHSAARLMKEGGAQMVKLEGGGPQLETVQALSRQGIPVCAHLGLTPQSVHKLGGYRVQGREPKAAQAMLEDAVALEAAGADLLILECIPSALAEAITRALAIPVIGIGAGPACDGQVLVSYDLLGLSPRPPKFVRNYAQSHGAPDKALKAFVDDVRRGDFPGPEHCFT